MTKPTPGQYQQFIDKMKEALTPKLDEASLILLDAGLKGGNNSQEYVYVAWVERPITGHQVKLQSKITASIQETSVADVQALVATIVKQLIRYFHNEQKGKTITII